MTTDGHGDRIFTDPATNRQYTVNAAGQSVWLDSMPGGYFPHQPSRPPKRKHTGRNIVLTIVGVFVLLIIIGAIGSALDGTDDTVTTASSPTGGAAASLPATSKAPAAPSRPAATSKAPAAQAPAKAPATQAPAATSKAPAAQAPAGTASQRNALRAAKSYLDIKGFSRAGLIDQLSSEYGEQFSVADATWAADHVGADWNEQAVRAGRSYLDLKGFSRAGLIEQLSSEYGDQFTRKQATYAADKLGL